MPLFVAADLGLGAIAIGGWLWLRHRSAREDASTLDDEVVRADLASALKWWGAAVALLGILALGQFAGGFTLPIWSVLAVGLGVVGASVFVLRWRVEGWRLLSGVAATKPIRGESETWQFALIGWAGALGLTYFTGLLLHIMQPVHAAISVLMSAVGYALGLVVWTPQVKTHRVKKSASGAIADDPATPGRRSRRSRRGVCRAAAPRPGPAPLGDERPSDAGDERGQR